jgi:hypothetical protein
MAWRQQFAQTLEAGHQVHYLTDAVLFDTERLEARLLAGFLGYAEGREVRAGAIT